MADQQAIVAELYRRRDQLPPEKMAVVEELAKRYKLDIVQKVPQADYSLDRKSTRLNSSHIQKSRMPSSA